MDHAVLLVHGLVWAPFVARAVYNLATPGPAGVAPPGDAAPAAPNAGSLVALHASALVILYAGLAVALSHGVVGGPVLQAVGAGVVLAGGALSTWTLAVFRSWKLRAVIGADHELCTDGPFAWVRHPIYVAIDLFALGTLLWSPHWAVAVGAVVVIASGDVRARAEERVLTRVFGDRYVAYTARVSRFVPGVY